VVDQVSCELKVAPTVLVEWGEKGVEFFLGKADDVGSGFFSKLLEVELGSGAKCFESGCGSGWGRGTDDVGVGVDGGGFKGVWVNEGDAGASRRRGVLGGPGDVDGIGARARRFEEGEAGDDKFGTGGNSGRPGDDGGRCGTGGVLETGASRAWIIPSVVGTVEDVVDDLKGGGRVLLVDGVQVGPRGDGEGR